MNEYVLRRQAEQEQVKKNIIRLHAILREAGFIPKMQEQEQFYRAYAKGTRGEETLYLSADDYRNKNKIYVSGIFPRDSKNNYYEHAISETDYKSINISMDKTNEQIVKDINRRFMTGYREALSVVLERIANYEARYNKIKQATIKAGDIIGIKPENDDKIRYWDNDNKICSLDIDTLSNGEELSLKVRGDKSEMFKILKYVAELRK